MATAIPAIVAHSLELLSGLGAVRARGMFGGHGLYLDDLMIALIAFERLYLKVDSTTRERFAAAGGEPFVYDGKGKPVTMSYWTPPPEAMDSPAEMLPWARLALQAAVAARAAQPIKKAAASRGGVARPGQPGRPRRLGQAKR
jgi:DNA transformation protein and related proteins